MVCSIHCKAGLAAAALTVATAACTGSTAGSPGPFSEGPVPEAPGAEAWSPDEIRREEIRERGKNDQSAMQLIRRLRPAWLRARGQKSLTDPSTTYPVVYIDEIRHGGLSTLHAIPSSEILSMQFIGMADATIRWGTGHPSGVINIVTGR